MREDFNELRQAIISDLDAKLDAKFEASERRLRQDLTQDLGQELARQLETAQKHLEGCMQMHAEDLKELATKAAEGYGGTLEGIQRQLADLNQKVDDKFSVHEKTLLNHAERISALELR
ncbi:MAG: hypothetical protein ABI665_06190 [Vicinamibacterales bacterium]